MSQMNMYESGTWWPCCNCNDFALVWEIWICYEV